MTHVASDMDMVSIDVCQHALRNCPHVLISTADWQRAIEDWDRRNAISPRLRQRHTGGALLHHQKLRFAIAGCPNGCSRPQIADVGLVGFVRPAVIPEDCTTCGACQAACPDTAITLHNAPPVFDATACQGCVHCRNACPMQCITLSRPGVRVLLGGKLGRHPHLATPVAEMVDPADVLRLLDQVVGNYLEHATPGERFADFLLRTRIK